jgi:cell envelope opacity-associated protein A
MRAAVLAASTAVITFTLSFASAQTPAQSGPQNPAVKTEAGNNSDMPVKGSNSFTESEARSRVTAQGYTDVGVLRKDDDGVWRGMATKAGQRVKISVDYQGNVNAD